ncbi:unnamed protein product [Rhizophagus irregularis]|nr:unnamed protein product [Rhizophagus irregularis]
MQHPPPQLKLWRATVPQRAFYTIFGQTHFDVFKSAIITPLSPNHQFRKVCETILYDFFSMTSESRRYNKEIVFIEVSGGTEKAVLKHVKEDTEKLILYRQCDRVTLSESELRLDRKHFLHKVFELLYALIRAHKPNTPRLDPNSTETWEAIEIIYEDMNYDSFDDFDEYSW